MLTNLLAISSGLFLTISTGLFCSRFLKRSVRARLPNIVQLPSGDDDGGSKQLGTLELLLFFASIWLEVYVIAGGWLTFKVAAKWAAWHHIAKLPDKREPNDFYLDLRERLCLSNHLLGRFLNGTLYNVVCAGLGVIFAKIVQGMPIDSLMDGFYFYR